MGDEAGGELVGSFLPIPILRVRLGKRWVPIGACPGGLLLLRSWIGEVIL